MYDSMDLISVYDETGGGTGTLWGRYLHGPEVDEPLLLYQSSVTSRWVLDDYLGSARDIVVRNGSTFDIVKHQRHSAFGTLTLDTAPTLDFRFSFTGRIWDADADLYYYRARWYDADLGKFLSEDPSGFTAGDTNLTRYVGNSPQTFTDPTGMSWFSDVGCLKQREMHRVCGLNPVCGAFRCHCMHPTSLELPYRIKNYGGN